MTDYPFTVSIPHEDKFLNNGPWEFETLIDHVESVASIINEVEQDLPPDRVTEIRPEGEGHGILVQYEWNFAVPHNLALLDAGYAVSSIDDGRVFVIPFEGEIEYDYPYPNEE